MKTLSFIIGLSFLLIRSSCTSNDEPAQPVRMLPSAIDSTNDWNQYEHETYDYDDNGRIVDWTVTYNDRSMSTAKFSYPDENTILVSARDISHGDDRRYEETIQLVNGRAEKSEGTFVCFNDGYLQMEKTHQLEFEYDSSNHLIVIKHLEVRGIGENIKPSEWEKPWTWNDYLIWEDGNLKEFQNYGGSSSIKRAEKYEYFDIVVDYPIILPLVINNYHHRLLQKQGLFGSNPRNLISCISENDYFYKTKSKTNYTYEFEQSKVVGYKRSYDPNAPYPIEYSYKVYWTER